MAILYDRATRTYVALPKEDFELTLGRASNSDIPVPLHKDRGERHLGEILREDYPEIGERLDNDPEFNDWFMTSLKSTSRKHAVLKKVGNKVYLQDLGSRCGTYVNKIKREPDEEVVLEGIKEILLGEWRLEYHDMDVEPEKVILGLLISGEYKLRENTILSE